MDWFLCDRELHHERVKIPIKLSQVGKKGN